MNDFDFTEYAEDDFAERKPAQPRRRFSVWDALSIVTLMLTVCVGGYYLMLFINPYTSLNPLPPPAMVQAFQTPVPTITPLQLQATWTPTQTVEPSATPTKRPTITPFPTQTPFVLPTLTSRFTPTSTPRASATPKKPFSVSVQSIESTIIHPDAGCAWFGVGGEARDLNNSPILFLTVRVGGTLNGEAVDYLTVTGTVPQYGQGGFEIYLGNNPVDSRNALWIQLYDQAGMALSEKVFFNTFADCKKNLTLIRFKKIR